MNELIVRTAVKNDLHVLLKFEQALIEAERAFDPTIRTGDDVRYYDLEWLIESADAEIVVAEFDGETVGSGYAFIQASKAYLQHRFNSYLGFMYVVPEHRGKGVNKQILDVLETWSAARGVTEMQLEVYLQNAGAIRAYDKAGYTGNVLQMRKGLNEK